MKGYLRILFVYCIFVCLSSIKTEPIGAIISLMFGLSKTKKRIGKTKIGLGKTIPILV